VLKSKIFPMAQVGGLIPDGVVLTVSSFSGLGCPDAALPTALVYIFLGRFFTRGLLAGSVKG
jgi:hypothetical protein